MLTPVPAPPSLAVHDGLPLTWGRWAVGAGRACDCEGVRAVLICWGSVPRPVTEPDRGRRPGRAVAVSPSAEVAAMHCLDCGHTDIYDSGPDFDRWDRLSSTRTS